jgi:hypothetical protein
MHKFLGAVVGVLVLMGVTTQMVFSACNSASPGDAPARTDSPYTGIPSSATPTSAVASNAPQPTAVRLITVAPSDLNLTIDDFPAGWQMNERSNKDGGYEIRVIKLNSTFVTLLDKVVITWAKVLDDVPTASGVYQEERRNKGSTFRLDNPGIGDESYGYSGNATFEVFFRISNVVARAQMFNQYGGSDREAKQWAQKLADRIK